MSKVILRTALKTLLAVIIVIIIGFTVLSLGFPKLMASFLEDGGNYSFAAGYASLSYSYSGDVGDLARCVHDYMAAENDEKVAEFGAKLVKHEKFSDYCDSETERLSAYYDKKFDYRQYICGKIAATKYRLGDNFGTMTIIESAMDHVNFPANNALVQLVLMVQERNDKDFGDEILIYLETITPQESEMVYYNAVKSVLEELVK